MAAKETKTMEQADIAVESAAVESAAVKPKSWIVSVINGSTYCGIGAGGVQFANGRAEITSKRMADWFKEHEGYNVIEQ
jgi:hypothetical protein